MLGWDPYCEQRSFSVTQLPTLPSNGTVSSEYAPPQTRLSQLSSTAACAQWGHSSILHLAMAAVFKWARWAWVVLSIGTGSGGLSVGPGSCFR